LSFDQAEEAASARATPHDRYAATPVWGGSIGDRALARARVLGDDSRIPGHGHGNEGESAGEDCAATDPHGTVQARGSPPGLPLRAVKPRNTATAARPAMATSLGCEARADRARPEPPRPSSRTRSPRADVGPPPSSSPLRHGEQRRRSPPRSGSQEQPNGSLRYAVRPASRCGEAAGQGAGAHAGAGGVNIAGATIAGVDRVAGHE